MAMEANLGLRAQRGTHRRHPLADLVRQQVARRIGQVDTVGAVAFHQLALGSQAFGAVHVRHHQEAHGVHAQVAGVGDVLFADIGLGTVGGHPQGTHAQAVGHLQVLDRADAWQQQRRDLGLLHQRNHRRQVGLVTVRWEAVVDRAAAQAIAVGDFDQRHAGGIQAAGDALHFIEADLVALGVHAVAQAHVMYGNAFAVEVHGRLLRPGQWGQGAASARP